MNLTPREKDKLGKYMSKYNKNPETVSRLSPEQYRVTQRNGTERPFDNAYWDNAGRSSMRTGGEYGARALLARAQPFSSLCRCRGNVRDKRVDTSRYYTC